MAKLKEEELKAKAEEIAKEIADVLARHLSQPRIVLFAALSANLSILADRIEESGGPSAEKTINRFIACLEASIAPRNKNNA